MGPQSHQERIQHQFDSYCKKTIKLTARDCYRRLKRRGEREIVFSELSEQDLAKLAVTDEYFKDAYSFSALGFEITVSDIELAERPADILEHKQIGHWEMDTVKGKRDIGEPVLLVLTERKTRHEIIRKMPDGKQESVISILDSIERNIGTLFSKIFKSITVDNGSEFLNYKGLERSINGGKRTNVYFCYPYSAFERGSNENANKLIRRFIPKGAAISNYSDDYVSDIQNWINNYPRRILDYYTPLELLERELGDRRKFCVKVNKMLPDGQEFQHEKNLNGRKYF